MHEIRFARLREGAVIPSKRDEDSDYDLYACSTRRSSSSPPSPPA